MTSSLRSRDYLFFFFKTESNLVDPIEVMYASWNVDSLSLFAYRFPILIIRKAMSPQTPQLYQYRLFV